MLFAPIETYLFSFNSIFALGIFTAAAVALVAYKITVIVQHGPHSPVTTLFVGPFVFSLDLVCLMLLYRGFSAVEFPWPILAGCISLVIISCSASFVSLYPEVNWERSIEVPPI